MLMNFTSEKAVQKIPLEFSVIPTTPSNQHLILSKDNSLSLAVLTENSASYVIILKTNHLPIVLYQTEIKWQRKKK